MLETVAKYGGGDIQQGAVVLNGIITQQSMQIGFNEIFHLLGIIFIAVIAVVWIAKPPFSAKGGPGAEAGGH